MRKVMLSVEASPIGELKGTMATLLEGVSPPLSADALVGSALPRAEENTFDLSQLRVGSKALLKVTASGRASFYGYYSGERPPQSWQRVSLKMGAMIRGRVVDESGRPVSFASFIVQSPVQYVDLSEPPLKMIEGTAATRVVVSMDGSFSLDGIPVGKSVLILEGNSSHLPSHMFADPVTCVNVSEELRVLSIELVVVAGVALRGQAVDIAGKPCPNLEVTLLSGGTALTRSDGTFEFLAVSPRHEYLVDVVDPNGLLVLEVSPSRIMGSAGFVTVVVRR
ncbi:MAG: carboxypeptidase regulatory-like domain-containing protein [Planctomycetes bacterium]|nr:carboxypeptidase regulatory-like domain-containing protein [Planctomycetota bacterium]